MFANSHLILRNYILAVVKGILMVMMHKMISKKYLDYQYIKALFSIRSIKNLYMITCSND